MTQSTDPGPGGGPAGSNIFGLERDALAALLEGTGAPPFHAAQIYHWIYGRKVAAFAAMTDLPSRLRDALGERHHIAWPEVLETRQSSDGSRKYVLSPPGGGEIEAVYIVYGSRITLCLSSQVGCPLDCRFCSTGTMGLTRNLTAGEIAGQVAAIARDTGLDPAASRIVFMGMGEPLANYDAVLAAFRILVDPMGFGLPARRVTLSTAGLIPGIERLALEGSRPRLAVSLVAGDDPLRSELMPLNRRHGLDRLMETCRRFPLRPRERITFEYVLLAGVNDDPRQAAAVAARVRGVRCKVNVIPYNDAGMPGFRTPEPEIVSRFRDALLERGIPVTVRWSRGRDIAAACGQLVRGSARRAAEKDP
jgi:23S rRNA (adenine2503-C2)-methyltransferase